MPAQNYPIHLDSSRQGHPVLTGQVGTAENLFYQCLVNGFNAQTATSVTRSGPTVTFTKTSHGFQDYDWVLISGAVEPEYNGTFQILPGATADTFQYTIVGSPTSPATGVVVAKFQPLGWTRELTSGNKAIFKADSASSGCELRVDDSGSLGTQSYRVAFLRGTYGHTDIDTPSKPFPLVSQVTNGLVFHKSSTLDSTERQWDIYGNGRFFYVSAAYYAGALTVFNMGFFGDPISFVPSPAYPACIMFPESDAMPATNNFITLNTQLTTSATGKYAATSYNQVGDPIPLGMVGFGAGLNSLGSSGMANPNPADNGYSMSSVFVTGSNTIIAKMPGIYHIWHNQPYSNRSTLPEFPDLPGRRIMLLNSGTPIGSVGRVPIDLTGPIA